MFKDYDDKDKVAHSISALEGDRIQEFKELASALGISQSTENWKELVTDFCLNFKECFSIFTDNKDLETTERNQIDQCFTLMKQIGKGKSSMREVTSLQNIADTLAKEFRLIYNHI